MNRRSESDDKVALYSCARCGGVNVQSLEWVDANLPVVVGTNEGCNDDDTWCEDCEDHTGLKVNRVAKEEFARRCGFSRAIIYFYCADTNRPDEQSMVKMCQVLDVPFEEGLAQYTPKKAGRPAATKGR